MTLLVIKDKDRVLFYGFHSEGCTGLCPGPVFKKSQELASCHHRNLSQLALEQYFPIFP